MRYGGSDTYLGALSTDTPSSQADSFGIVSRIELRGVILKDGDTLHIPYTITHGPGSKNVEPIRAEFTGAESLSKNHKHGITEPIDYARQLEETGLRDEITRPLSLQYSRLHYMWRNYAAMLSSRDLHLNKVAVRIALLEDELRAWRNGRGETFRERFGFSVPSGSTIDKVTLEAKPLAHHAFVGNNGDGLCSECGHSKTLGIGYALHVTKLDMADTSIVGGQSPKAEPVDDLPLVAILVPTSVAPAEAYPLYKDGLGFFAISRVPYFVPRAFGLPSDYLWEAFPGEEFHGPVTILREDLGAVVRFTARRAT